MRRSGASIGVSLFLLAAVAVGAQPAGAVDEREVQARTEFAAGRFQQAADLFARLYGETMDPLFLRNVGRCYQKLGKPDEAISAFESYLEKARKVTAKDRREVEGYIKDLKKLKASGPAAPAPVAQPAPSAPAPASSAPPPAAAARPAPAAPRVAAISAGGTECARSGARIDFEGALPPMLTARGIGRSFSSPVRDTTRAWCGGASLRVQLDFSLDAAKVRGNYPHQLAELYISLPEKVDFTSKTLTARVYVDTTSAFPFGGQVAAFNQSVFVDGTQTQNLRPGTWFVLKHRFGVDNRLYSGGSAKATDLEGVVVQLWAMGTRDQRTWSGTVYVDDISWE